MNDANNTKTLSTTDLFQAAHRALFEKRWSEARRLLDDLGRRDDNSWPLSSARVYECPEQLHDVIQDRIDLVNSKAQG